MKYILVIGDGMADDPIPELDGKTPLEYATIPTLDKLACSGVLGSVSTIPEGMPAGSDTAIMSIFGCDPCKFYTGRAPLEAAATGIPLCPGDVAYRCNMISVENADIPFEDKKILSHSAGSIEGTESNKLILDLFNEPVFKEAADKAGITIHPGSSFRHIAVQKCSDLIGKQEEESSATFASVGRQDPFREKVAEDSSSCFLTLTPPHDHLGEELGRHLPRGGENAAALEELIRLSHEFLDTHPINHKRRLQGKLPANCIWFWAEGTSVTLPDFTEKYGKSGSIISAVPLCQGIGNLIGLERIIVDGATGELHTNYEGKVDAAIKSLEKNDFTTIHIEAPDECTHNGDLKGKLQAIEWVDSRVLTPLLSKLNQNKTEYRLLVMSDHRTLIHTRGHDSGAVPYVLFDSRLKKETGLSFNEKNAENEVFIPCGTDLMTTLFEE